MKKTLFVIGLLLALSSFSAWAQKDSNVKPQEKAEQASAGINAQLLAANLVQYGIAHEEALPLIEALQLMKDHPLVDGQISKDGKSEQETGKAGTVLSYDEVLAKAKEFAGGDAVFTQLIAKVNSGERGRTTGETCHEDLVLGNHTDTYTMRFRGGEKAEVAVIGDGDTDLDLYIYDNNGNLIGKDIDYGDDCYVSWYPRRTGSFKIKIKNLGSIANRYLLLTN